MKAALFSEAKATQKCTVQIAEASCKLWLSTNSNITKIAILALTYFIQHYTSFIKFAGNYEYMVV